MPYSQSHQVGPIQSRPIIITGIICLKVYYHHHHMVWTFLGQLTCISPLFDIELLLTALVVNEKKKNACTDYTAAVGLLHPPSSAWHRAFQQRKVCSDHLQMNVIQIRNWCCIDITVSSFPQKKAPRLSIKNAHVLFVSLELYRSSLKQAKFHLHGIMNREFGLSWGLVR